jgi:organic radical activating enzyme
MKPGPLPIVINDKKIFEIKNQSNFLLLTWVINNICTNHCSYCPKNLHSGSNHHYDWAVVEPFIRQCFERYNSVHCSISGGEPTVSPFFKDLVNLIYDLGGSTVLTTNLVRNKTYWEDIAEKICTISVSYHPEFIKTDIQEQELIDKILYLSKHTYVSVRLMMVPSLWNQCMNFYKKLLKVNDSFSVSLVRLLPNFGSGKNYFTIEYTKAQEFILSKIPVIDKCKPDSKILNHRNPLPFLISQDGNSVPFSTKTINELVNNKKTNFFGWKCSIGLESLFVHYNGNVQRGNCTVGGLIGNINSEIRWPTQPVICNKTLCHCSSDIVISKKMEE